VRARWVSAALVVAVVATVPASAAVSAPGAQGVVMSWYPFYRTNFSSIPVERLTHLGYAMVEHGPGGIARPRPEDTGFARNVAALRAARTAHPGLKLIMGIGGAGDWSAGFAPATVPAQVGASARSAVALMRKNGFDGIDIDWESPKLKTTEPAQYVTYLKALRAEMDTLSKTTRRRYILSTDVSFLAVDPFNEQGKDQTPPAAARSVDYWNVMAYEMRGAWNCFGNGGGAGFNAPLRPIPGDPYARNGGAVAVAAWRRLGVPAKKIVFGIPFYGSLFNDVTQGPKGDGLGQSCKGNASRQIDGPEIATLGAAQGFEEHYDTHSEAAYRYNPTSKQFLSYETARSIAAKRRFVAKQGLAGVMSWDLGADDSAFTLLSALSGATR
jgi:chitinase